MNQYAIEFDSSLIADAIKRDNSETEFNANHIAFNYSVDNTVIGALQTLTAMNKALHR